MSAKRRTLERYLVALERIGDQPGLVACLRRLAEVAEEEGAWADVLAYCARALVELPADAPRAYRAEGHLLVGRAATRLESYDVARNHLIEASLTFRAEGRPAELALCFELLAELSLRGRDGREVIAWAPYPAATDMPADERAPFAEAARLFAESATTYLDAGMALSGLVAFAGAARCHFVAVEHEAARLCLMAALQLTEIIEDTPPAPQLALVALLVAYGDRAAAETLLDPLLRSVPQLDTPSAVRVCELVGCLALRDGSSVDSAKEALRHVQRAAGLSFEEHDHRSLVRLSLLHALLAVHLGRDDGVEAQLKRALAAANGADATQQRGLSANVVKLVTAHPELLERRNLRAHLESYVNP
ncbi:MAG: hypothetical protein KC609_22585 [Myxococcales bacterium]|nr:hypothetical protein [Myxococcales bacterium]